MFLFKSRAGGVFPPEGSHYEQTVELLRLSPTRYGFVRSTWTVDMIGQVAFPELVSYSGIYKRLRCWNISRKQARLHISSPDPLYQAKKQAVDEALAYARAHPQTHRLLYADEASFYRQPSLTRCFSANNQRPLAYWPGGYATRFRICSTLDALTGETEPSYRSAFDVKGLCSFLERVRARYGPSMHLTIAWDNWPVHKHDDVLRKAQELEITLLLLPTYAPWTNPIEKLWRLLRQELAHMHEYVTKQEWPHFKAKVIAFMQRYAVPSPDLLRYVGLQPKCTD